MRRLSSSTTTRNVQKKKRAKITNILSRNSPFPEAPSSEHPHQTKQAACWKLQRKEYILTMEIQGSVEGTND